MECVYANADWFLNTNGIGQLHLTPTGETMPQDILGNLPT